MHDSSWPFMFACAAAPPGDTVVHFECHAGDVWRLHVTVNEFVYVMTAADILQPGLPQGTSANHSAMRGRLASAGFQGYGPFGMVGGILC